MHDGSRRISDFLRSLGPIDAGEHSEADNFVHRSAFAKLLSEPGATEAVVASTP